MKGGKMKLTKAQRRVLKRLQDHGGWQTAYRLGAQCQTLDILHLGGLVDIRGGGLGSCFSPETTFEYKVKEVKI